MSTRSTIITVSVILGLTAVTVAFINRPRAPQVPTSEIARIEKGEHARNAVVSGAVTAIEAGRAIGAARRERRAAAEEAEQR